MKVMLFVCLILIPLFGFGCSVENTEPAGEEIVEEEEVNSKEEAEEEIPEGAVVITQEDFDRYLEKISWLYAEAELSKEKLENLEGVTAVIINEDLSEENLKELAKKEASKMEVGEIYFEEKGVSALPEEIEEMTLRHVERFDTSSKEHMFILLQDVFGYSREDILRDIEFEVKLEKVAAERVEDISLVLSFEDEEVERGAKMSKAKKEVLEEIMQRADEKELIIK